MEVMDAKTQFVVANTTNRRGPAFTVTGLRPGTGYRVTVRSANAKGRSQPVRVHAFTTSAPVNQRKSGGGPGESALTTVGEFQLTPILAILMVVGGALILVFVIIAAYFCVRNSTPAGGRVGSKRSKGAGQNGRQVRITIYLPQQ